jgi:hypothetical protein
MPSQIVRASLLLLVFSLACHSQDSLAVVRGWLPSVVGDRWIYEEEIRDGNREQLEVERWGQEDVTVAVETVPQGVLIRRKVSFRNNTYRRVGSEPPVNPTSLFITIAFTIWRMVMAGTLRVRDSAAISVKLSRPVRLWRVFASRCRRARFGVIQKRVGIYGLLPV